MNDKICQDCGGPACMEIDTDRQHYTCLSCAGNLDDYDVDDSLWYNPEELDSQLEDNND